MADLHDLRKRLRQRLRPTGGNAFLPPPTQAGPASDLGVVGDSFLPPLSGSSAATAQAAVGLETAVPGEVVSGPWGEAWRVRRACGELREDGAELAARLRRPGQAPWPALVRALAEPEAMVFFDLETCGLLNAPLFLCGTAGLGPDGLTLELLLARQRAEEAAAIGFLAERLATASVLVTFNGEAFDVPFLQGRARYYGLQVPLPDCHLDLLPLCRGQFGKRYGNCRLQTLEQQVCRRRRSHEEIPSAQIPRAYDDYCRTGDASALRAIVYHNAMDLLTLADLLAHLAGN